MKSLFTNIQKQKNILKISVLFMKLTNFTGKYSRIVRIKIAKFSGYCFYMNTNIQGDFQIYISVPFSLKSNVYFPQRSRAKADNM